jgi:S-adenosylmethionine hydrolase
MTSIVAILTDFGSQDHYVGSVKGAILSACPTATLVDIAHELPAHDVAAAALSLGACYRAFPGGTVFLAVVDPGVGSERRGLAIEAGGYRFVGPDNGIFTEILRENPAARVHEITNAGLFRYHVSLTFHARDVFGPVAGHLARGAALGEVGPPTPEPLMLPEAEVLPRGDREWEASVLQVDRFGSLITSLRKPHLDAALALTGGDPTELVVVVEQMIIPFVNTYSEVSEGELCALVGGSGGLEVAVNRGNASRTLGAGRGSAVLLRALGMR